MKGREKGREEGRKGWSEIPGDVKKTGIESQRWDCLEPYHDVQENIKFISSPDL